MPSIFHYTDTAGAVGILSTQSLFASDCRYLNDSSEGVVIDSLLMPVFLDLKGAGSGGSFAKGLLRRAWVKRRQTPGGSAISIHLNRN
jgi:hypothetical protein